ncbi:MAG: hypothetical protein QXP91_11845 [Candidatus Methanomethylicia archaeon]
MFSFIPLLLRYIFISFVLYAESPVIFLDLLLSLPWLTLTSSGAYEAF